MTSLSTTLPRISSSTAPPAAPEVLSNPVSALAVPNGKSIQNCTELHLTHSSITKLAGFDRFENLDTLWLNNNNLVRVSGLDENSRIQRLYLNNNNLVSLRGFENCTFLNVSVSLSKLKPGKSTSDLRLGFPSICPSGKIQRHNLDGGTVAYVY